MLDEYIHESELFVRADCCIPYAAILDVHLQAKQRLIERVLARSGVALHPKLPNLGFARRMTAYKLPNCCSC